MSIPSGDLAPARKHGRRYRRRRSLLPLVLVVLLVAAIAGGSYLLRREDNTAATVSAGARCPSAGPTALAPQPAPVKAAPAKAAPVRLPAPGQVGLRLLNGSGRDGLARVVGNELARRGFRVTAMGNAPRPLVGASRVYYGPGGRPAALLVSTHVLGASVVPVPAAARGAIDVVLGSTFPRLRTPAETSAFARQLVTGAVPVTPAAPKPAPSPTCR